RHGCLAPAGPVSSPLRDTSRRPRARSGEVSAHQPPRLRCPPGEVGRNIPSALPLNRPRSSQQPPPASAVHKTKRLVHHDIPKRCFVPCPVPPHPPGRSSA